MHRLIFVRHMGVRVRALCVHMCVHGAHVLLEPSLCLCTSARARAHSRVLSPPARAPREVGVPAGAHCMAVHHRAAEPRGRRREAKTVAGSNGQMHRQGLRRRRQVRPPWAAVGLTAALNHSRGGVPVRSSAQGGLGHGDKAHAAGAPPRAEHRGPLGPDKRGLAWRQHRGPCGTTANGKGGQTASGGWLDAAKGERAGPPPMAMTAKRPRARQRGRVRATTRGFKRLWAGRLAAVQAAGPRSDAAHGLPHEAPCLAAAPPGYVYVFVRGGRGGGCWKEPAALPAP
ncbi:MAG: hypothetical protein J3K34DRAFT_133165 [Monoraphidium minutum]|nr:MAG: hypothetical protein J3K34DRAFT_133165 [Monoraphidium minutum]